MIPSPFHMVRNLDASLRKLKGATTVWSVAGCSSLSLRSGWMC